MKSSPKVIFNQRFRYSINNNDNRNNKTYEKTIKKKINGMFDYYSNEEKKIMTLFDYYTGDLNKDKKMNLVLEDGTHGTKEQIYKRKKQYAEYIKDSNLWQGVISFNNDYIDENIDIKELESVLAKDIIPKFIKECGFVDVKNMSYQFALHDDTDNYHFHFSMIEKKPNYLTKNNRIEYRRKGLFSLNEINFLKRQTVLAIERKKVFNPLVKELNTDIDILKGYFKYNTKNYVLRDKKDLILEENILRLGKLLNDRKISVNAKIKYNSIKDKEIKDLTNNIKKYIFSKKNDSLNLSYDNFKESLDKINYYFYQLDNDNNIKGKLDLRYTELKNNYLDNFVYNTIVNKARNTYDTKSKKMKFIKDNDIIESIVLKEYIKNKKYSKLDILKNYLTNTTNETRFRNKSKINNAIKNINNEIEETQEEFSKLFKDNLEK